MSAMLVVLGAALAGAQAPESRSIFDGLSPAARAEYEAGALSLGTGQTASGARLFPVRAAKDGRADPVLLVLPGGAYRYHAAAEGVPIAEAFRDAGFAAFVLQYRLLPDFDPEVDALADAQRAVRLLRARAHELELDPDRIAVIGFSAGGHLAANLSLHGDDGSAHASDPVERQSSRVQAVLLIYPGILSIRYARPPAPRSAVAVLEGEGLHRQVGPSTPPTFLAVGYDDTRTPYEGCLAYAARLHEAGVRFELHVFGHGDHGAPVRDGRRPEWTRMALDWMQAVRAGGR
jgi:acetyl esterase/lipase